MKYVPSFSSPEPSFTEAAKSLTLILDHQEKVADMQAREKDDSADDAMMAKDPVGGIDFNPAVMHTEVERDGRGLSLPLPLPEDLLQYKNADGFIPIIINVAPINVPLLLGLADQDQPQHQNSEDSGNSPPEKFYREEEKPESPLTVSGLL